MKLTWKKQRGALKSKVNKTFLLFICALPAPTARRAGAGAHWHYNYDCFYAYYYHCINNNYIHIYYDYNG